jgi:hypothetical protein
VNSPARRAAVVISYAILAVVLGWSHLVRLGGGYCCDEIRTVVDYVGEGPRAILAGPYVPNNHQLFSIAGWATSSLIGESAIALRLWSVIPFLLGVAVVTIWLHRRCGALSGLLFLSLATLSPLLLDITRMARGYGLAFFAMSVLVVATLEAERTGRTAWLVLAVTGGLVGSLTLPHFTVALVATAVALLARPDLRVRVLVSTAAALVCVAAWYAPHLDDIASETLGDYGRRIDTAWLLTAPIDQTIVPGVTLLDDAFLEPSLVSLLWVAGFAVVIASSPFMRQLRPALVLWSGTLATVAAFWATGTHVVPRFFSFLLVPLFMLVATGAAAALSDISTRARLLRAATAVATLCVIVVSSVSVAIDVPRLPRDAGSEAAATIRDLVPESTPVFAHLAYPLDLEFHLGRAVTKSWTPSSAREVCATGRLAVYVDQPYLVPTAVVPCTQRPGTRHYRFEQYARGKRIDVWIIPAATT